MQTPEVVPCREEAKVVYLNLLSAKLPAQFAIQDILKSPASSKLFSFFLQAREKQLNFTKQHFSPVSLFKKASPEWYAFHGARSKTH